MQFMWVQWVQAPISFNTTVPNLVNYFLQISQNATCNGQHALESISASDTPQILFTVLSKCQD